jgi:hypothetical protein
LQPGPVAFGLGIVFPSPDLVFDCEDAAGTGNNDVDSIQALFLRPLARDRIFGSDAERVVVDGFQEVLAPFMWFFEAINEMGQGRRRDPWRIVGVEEPSQDRRI